MSTVRYSFGVDRRTNYLETALRLFLEHGFNGVSMDQLVAEAGGSKATLYRYFASKEALFDAIIDDIATQATPSGTEDDWNRVDLEEGLQLLGRATAAGALDERTTVIFRLAVGEHSRFPNLARTLFEQGPGRTYERLKRFLAAKQTEGVVAIDDLQIAAEQFLGGIVGHQQLRAALGVGSPTAADIDARIDAAVRSFMATYSTG